MRKGLGKPVVIKLSPTERKCKRKDESIEAFEGKKGSSREDPELVLFIDTCRLLKPPLPYFNLSRNS